LAYGQTLLSAAEVAEYESAPGLPTVEVMAREADAYWPGRVSGLQQSGHLLSFHGLYQGIYRVGSRPTHGTLAVLDPYVELQPTRTIVRPAKEHVMVVYSLAAPLLAMALVIVAPRFAWIDEARVRRFVDRATAETARRREARSSAP
jgi:hypothetical protein